MCRIGEGGSRTNMPTDNGQWMAAVVYSVDKKQRSDLYLPWFARVWVQDRCVFVGLTCCRRVHVYVEWVKWEVLYADYGDNIVPGKGVGRSKTRKC